VRLGVAVTCDLAVLLREDAHCAVITYPTYYLIAYCYCYNCFCYMCICSFILIV
jgi:hypothetical protein